uniref:Uncharacterized protein n=1 Tax=Ananas comosus var. bracteatus TaxID=296719 RepID=A0A6V7PL75_ANACO|nr:unnamed protein product [Ananas comosus var. bracteatus]
MLSSLNNPSSSSIKSHDDHDSEEDPHPTPTPTPTPTPSPPIPANPNFHLSTAATPSPSPSLSPSPRELLVGCADLFGRGDFPAARRLAASLLSSSSPLGDSSDRLATASPAPSSSSSPLNINITNNLNNINNINKNYHYYGRRSSRLSPTSPTPRLPSASPAPAPTPPSSSAPPTASAPSPAPSTSPSTSTPSSSPPPPPPPPPPSPPLSIPSPPPFPSETLALNFPFFLHKLLCNDDQLVVDFLRSIKAMNPAVVTVAEREGCGGGGNFVQRFVEAVDYYAAMFESMEATVPPGSRERLAVEGLLLGREIEAAVASAAAAANSNSNSNANCLRRRFDRWEAAMTAAGFAGRPLSGFALSQARLLLRLHYPSEGYRLEMVRGAFFLGWQSKPLFSVSSWH